MTIGIALLLDLAGRAPRAPGCLHSHAAFSAAAAASAAAALSASGVPLSARHLFGFPGITVAHCDAGAAYGLNDTPDLVNNLNNKIYNSLQYPIKEYPLELKPLFSALGYKKLGATTVRSFLLYYLPLLEPRSHYDEDDDDDLLHDAQEKPPLDLVTPFYKSVKQIIREISVVTTRRVLERIAVCHLSQRTSWKLLKGECFLGSSQIYLPNVGLKGFWACGVLAVLLIPLCNTLGYRAFMNPSVGDICQHGGNCFLCCSPNSIDASKSSKRKARRGMPVPEYTYCVARTTFRAHALGVASTWAVQSVVEVYKYFVCQPDNDKELFDEMKRFRLFRRKIYSVTIKCGFSLVFASLGACLGALLHPEHGQWIGCSIGDFAGPVVAIYIFQKYNSPLQD